MAFVKLDCGILNSTLWVDRTAREMFITALLLAEPFEAREPVKQVSVNELTFTGYEVPPGWYGFVPAAGPGIARVAGIDWETAKVALQNLGSPDEESRSQDFEGRRMIRIDGGYLILNYDKYRQKDYTSAERSRRYREKKFAKVETPCHAVTDDRHAVTGRSVTQAEAEAEGYNTNTQTDLKVHEPRIPTYEAWLAYAMEKYPAWPHADVRRAWEHYESLGWKKGRTPIQKWKLCASTCFQNHAKFSGGGNGGAGSNALPPARPVRAVPAGDTAALQRLLQQDFDLPPSAR